MTPSGHQQARRATVALTRHQVESICHDMGWGPEDAEAFWKFARHEARDPGCLDRERRAYWERIVQQAEGGQQ